jgi:hypothetical protein
MPKREEEFTEEELERQEWIRFCRQAIRELVDKNDNPKTNQEKETPSEP